MMHQNEHAFRTQLPRNQREFIIFALIVSVVSVNTIPVLITGLEVGFSLEMWRGVLVILPLLWSIVIVLVFLIQKPIGLMICKMTMPTDSFVARVTIEILCNVLLLSVLLTVIGGWVGAQRVSLDPVVHFFELLPRNFTIALFIELLIAQPIARAILYFYHRRVDGRER